MPTRDSNSWPAGRWRSDFRRRLLAWYGRHARELPWRRNRDPYRVWLSEIMLQQTQVATVRPYFERFIAALPNIRALAEADERQVLRLWEGLGYYRRARQLHRAAKVIVAEHGGRFPAEMGAARRLPGVGRYTAGAILSIAFDASEPILEANTVRLFSRLLAFRGDPHRGAGREQLWQAAEAILPQHGAGALNQALMELGSQICLPRDPECLRCPVAALCPTHHGGLHVQIPPPKDKPRVEAVREAAVIIRRRGRVLLSRRGPHERWAGLWDFPRVTCDIADRPAEISEVVAKVHAQTGIRIEQLNRLTTLQHTVTRYRITLECFEARVSAATAGQRPRADSRWIRPSELESYPLNTTGRKLAELAAEDLL